MQARMKNPAMIVPDALQALQTLAAATEKAGVPPRTLALAHLRASQINGCSVCVDMARLAKKKTGETEERLFAVAAWREMPYFTDAERAALALTEAVTRLDEDGVADPVWDAVVAAYGEATAAELVVAIATINVWNRLAITNHAQPPALVR